MVHIGITNGISRLKREVHHMTNLTLKMLETMRTKANTEFMAWWPLLNAELTRRGWGEAGFSDAKGCWEMGEAPETAAQQLIAVWS